MVYELPEELYQATLQIVGKLACETGAPLYMALAQLQPLPPREKKVAK